MKLGNALVLLILILVMAGYLLSDDLHVREEWNETRSEIDQLRARLARSEMEKEALRQQLHEVETQNAALKAQVDALQNQPQIERDSHIATPLQSRMEAKTLQQQPQTQAMSLNWTLIFLGWAVLLVLMTAGVVALGLRKTKRRGYPYYD